MRTELNVEFDEKMPDNRVKIAKGKIIVNHNERLRKKIYSYCNDIAYIQKLGKYDKKKRISISLKDSKIEEYSQAFYINKKGRVIPLEDFGLFHNWTYGELLRIKEKGLSKGQINTIKVSMPDGGLGGGVEETIQQIAIGVTANILSGPIYKRIKVVINWLRKQYYIKKYRNHIKNELFNEIILKKKSWEIEEINNLFYFSDIESKILLQRNNYHKNKSGKWVRKQSPIKAKRNRTRKTTAQR